jgi:hypothetical protein
MVSKFLGFAKDLVQSMRAGGSTTLDGPLLHQFRMMVAYYTMSGLSA